MSLIEQSTIHYPEFKGIIDKIIAQNRISQEECLHLFQKSPLALLSLLANFCKERISDKTVFYNKNLHIEPTNQCLLMCPFCSYAAKNHQDAYNFSITEIIEKIGACKNKITEVHIVGGVHPTWNLKQYVLLLKEIVHSFPTLHIKAFTAQEIHYFVEESGMNINKVFKNLKESGLQSMPGGGAEIFEPAIRDRICPNKISGQQWLDIHQTAHQNGIPTNATMLYGHFESIEQRLQHLYLLRQLQDTTHGFNAFIPLKFRNKNNQYSNLSEATLIDDFKTFAIARIFLDNIPHLKAYWPMLGINNAQMLLAFGVDDLDGTINNSTTIYTRAGVNTKNSLSEEELHQLIEAAGLQAVERDSLYNPINLKT